MDIEKEPAVLIDPDTFLEDGTVAVTGVFLSINGTYAAYSLKRGGSGWQEIVVKNMETGKDCVKT
jgi:prolyl oligopeptidase